jgi:transposase-like protein
MYKDCGRTFNDTTTSPLEYTKSSLKKWLVFIQCMVRGMSLRKTAKYVGIHYTTAFY